MVNKTPAPVGSQHTSGSSLIQQTQDYFSSWFCGVVPANHVVFCLNDDGPNTSCIYEIKTIIVFIYLDVSNFCNYLINLEGRLPLLYASWLDDQNYLCMIITF